MALGDAMFGLGIGLQGQAKLNMNAPMQAFKQRQAAKAAKQKALDDQVSAAMKDFLKFEGYHNKYLPTAKEEVLNNWQELNNIIERGEANARNQIAQILGSTAEKLESYKNSSNVLFDYEKNSNKYNAPPGFNEALANAGDFSDFEKLQADMAAYGVEYNPERKTLQNKFSERADMPTMWGKLLDEQAPSEVISTDILVAPDGRKTKYETYRPNKEARMAALDSSLKNNKSFSQTFMSTYGLKNLDPTDPTVIAAKDAFDEGVKNMKVFQRQVSEAGRGGFSLNIGGGATGVTTGMADVTQAGTPAAGRFMNFDGRLSDAGNIATRADLYAPVALPKSTATGENTSFVVSSNSIVPLESGAAGVAGAKDTGAVYNVSKKGNDVTYSNKTLKEGTTQAIYNAVAYPVQVTKNKVVKKSEDGQTTFTFDANTVVTESIGKSIVDNERKTVLALIGKSVTDPVAAKGQGRDALVIVDKSNFNSILNTISPGTRWNSTTGEVTFAKGDKDPAIPFVELYNQIYGAQKKELGGVMGAEDNSLGEGEITSMEYTSMKPLERLNFIRTPKGTYKKK